MFIQIIHNAVNAQIITDDKNIKFLVSDLLSYHISGYEMTNKYLQGSWDGKSTLFNYNKCTFPAGMVKLVKLKLQQAGHTVNVVTPEIPEPLGLPPGVKLSKFDYEERYKYQYDTVDKLIANKQIIARLATGAGKSNCCLIATGKIGRKTLFITTRKSLMYQMKENYESVGYDVGVIGDGVFEEKPLVNVAMVQTLASHLKYRSPEEELKRLVACEDEKIKKLISAKEKSLTNAVVKKKITVFEKRELLKEFEKDASSKRTSQTQLQKSAFKNSEEMKANKKRMESFLETFEFVVAEEAHESGASDYFDVMKSCRNAWYRLALTATPFMRDDEEANMRLMACSGPVAIVVSEKQLIDDNILAKPYFKYIDTPRPLNVFPYTQYIQAYENGVVKNEKRNDAVVSECIWAKKNNLPTLILVNRVKHGEIISEKLEKAGVNFSFIKGEDDAQSRKRELSRLKDKEIDVLIGTNILDVGVDVPSIGMVILAAGGKAEVQLRQRIGRGLRAKKNGKNITFIVDFNDSFNKSLNKHYLERRKIIEDTEGFNVGIVQDFEGIL